MFFAKLKAKALAAGALLLFILALLTRNRYLKNKTEELKTKVKREKLRADQSEAVADADSELDRVHSDAQREAAENVKQGKKPSNLEKPNDW